MNTSKSPGRNDRPKEIVTGSFFIAATVTAITGLLLYGPLLNNTGDLDSISRHSNQIALGAVFELLLAISNIGTGIMLYPKLKKYSESWGLGYVCFRLMEVVFIVIGIISLLSLLKINNGFLLQGRRDIDTFMNIANTLKSIHGWAFTLGPHFMLGINTFIYSFIFFKSNLIPRKISFLGLLGSVLIAFAALLEIFDINSPFSQQTMLLAIPVATYEMILAFWLIFKGFNAKTNESGDL